MGCVTIIDVILGTVDTERTGRILGHSGYSRLGDVNPQDLWVVSSSVSLPRTLYKFRALLFPVKKSDQETEN